MKLIYNLRKSIDEIERAVKGLKIRIFNPQFSNDITENDVADET